MDQITQQIESLNTRVRRQQYAIVALSAVLAGMALLGAARPVENATFDKITCREWEVVDKDGKVRIKAAATGLGLFDSDERLRIALGSIPNQGSALTCYDRVGRLRLSAGTLDRGSASINLFDTKAQGRVNASVLDDGEAGISWADKSGKVRMVAAITSKETVIYPTATGE